MKEMLALAEELRFAFEASGMRVILLLGGPDSGKTTLAEALARAECRRRKPAAVVDCDVGQSHIGPPAAVSWACCTRPFGSLEQLPLRGIFFTGDISPSGNTAACLEGVRRMFGAASHSRGRIFIDTDGYVKGREAVRFKARLAALVRPDCVIACEVGDELEPVLKRIHCRLLIKKAVAGIIRRSPAVRSRYRAGRFRDYFKSAFIRSFPRGILTSRIPLPPEAQLRGRLAGLMTGAGAFCAVGVILKATKKEISVLAPCAHPAEVTALVPGKASLPG